MSPSLLWLRWVELWKCINPWRHGVRADLHQLTISFKSIASSFLQFNEWLMDPNFISARLPLFRFRTCRSQSKCWTWGPRGTSSMSWKWRARWKDSDLSLDKSSRTEEHYWLKTFRWATIKVMPQRKSMVLSHTNRTVWKSHILAITLQEWRILKASCLYPLQTFEKATCGSAFLEIM